MQSTGTERSTLTAYLFKEHLGADDDVATGGRGALGEGRAARHVGRVKHDGLVGQERIREHTGTLRWDGADNDADV